MTKHTTNGKSVQVVVKEPNNTFCDVHNKNGAPLSVKEILATLTPGQLAEMRKVLGGVKASKKAGPGEFAQAVISLCEKVQVVLVDEKVPSPFCLELGRDIEGFYFCHVARIRHKYGPRKEEQTVVAE